jgi:hypothetical protein
MHKIEIQNLSASNRYHHFITTLAETGELWTLIDDTGSFALFEVENKTVISFWPEELFIESNLTPDWIDCIPFKLDMDALEETVIPFIRQNHYLINVFPVDSRTGYIVNLTDFVTDLNNQIENIE